MANSKTETPKKQTTKARDQKKSKSPIPAVEKVAKKQLGFIAISKKTWLEVSSFWRPLAGVTATYGVLYFIFVMSFTLNSNVQQLISDTSGKLPQALSVITDTMFNSYSGTQSDATTLVQILLFITATLALVWTLRRLQNLQTASIRDAYYEGPARIVPVLIVSLILLLTFIPSLIGSTILAYAIGASSGVVEMVVAAIISLSLMFASLYLFVVYWPAFYIVTLPQMRPLNSLGSAAKLTKKNRLAILRKFVLLGIACFVVLALLALPVALVIPTIVPYFLYIILFGMFMVVQVYLFELYRSLV